jgi:hypothetical protein
MVVRRLDRITHLEGLDRRQSLLDFRAGHIELQMTLRDFLDCRERMRVVRSQDALGRNSDQRLLSEIRKRSVMTGAIDGIVRRLLRGMNETHEEWRQPIGLLSSTTTGRHLPSWARDAPAGRRVWMWNNAPRSVGHHGG